ncbi:MAG: vWA domain-containing protein [Myxococcales bacterium]|jgi:hypothetical protein
MALPNTPVRIGLPMLLLCAALAGCDCGGAPEGVIDSCESQLGLPPSVTTDILFVIDNSRSMREEQEKVIAQLHTFVSSLVSGPVENDFQIGVVTTTISQYATTCDGRATELLEYPAESGRLQRGALAASEVPVLSSRDLETMGNAWLDKVRLLLDQGTEGSGQEMGLEAARRAVSEPLISTPVSAEPPGNQGFLRPGSRLLVIILSDEDDCSVPTPETFAVEPTCGTSCARDSDCGGEGNYCVLRDAFAPWLGRACVRNACEVPEGRAALVPVQQYVDFFKSMDDGTGRRREVFLAVIGPVGVDREPARCQGDNDEAYGVAVRYKAAVDGMGDNGLIDSICKDDYADTLRGIADLVSAPHTLELPHNPPDGHLLLVEIARESGEKVTCRMGEGFDFEPATDKARARVTLKGECRLRMGDSITLKLACAG